MQHINGVYFLFLYAKKEKIQFLIFKNKLRQVDLYETIYVSKKIKKKT